MNIAITRKRLHLRHRFTIARGSSDVKENIFVSLSHDGVEGLGEAAPNVRYGETPDSAAAALAGLGAALALQPEKYVEAVAELHARFPGEYAAKAALDMAIMDWNGKMLGQPVYRLWGLNPASLPPTSMTIGIDEPAVIAAKTREAGDFSVLKVKLGSADDRAIIRAIRAVSAQTLRVDANEGWTEREAAIREIEWLARQQVELIEQPMPAARAADMAWLKQRSPLPLVADEAFTGPADLPALRDCYHGVNIKLQKCGGMLVARETLAAARVLGLKIMVGCMIESSLGIAAAAHLSAGADWIDLDGHLLIADDPFSGLGLARDRLLLGAGAGLGVAPRA